MQQQQEETSGRVADLVVIDRESVLDPKMPLVPVIIDSLAPFPASSVRRAVEHGWRIAYVARWRRIGGQS